MPTVPPAEGREQQVEGAAGRVEQEEIEAGDWLARLRASAAPEAEEPETAGEPIEPVEIPDWLRDMGPIDVEAGTPPSEEPPSAEARLEQEGPTMPPPAVAEVADQLQELAPAEIPDWLWEAAAPDAAPPVAEAAPEEAVPTTPPPVPAEIPDWLQEMTPPEVAGPETAAPIAEAAVEEAVPAPTITPAEIPDWLREMAPPGIAEPEATPPAVEAAPPPSPTVAVPPAPEPPPEIAAEAGAPAEALPEAATVEVPEWLAQLEALPAAPPAPPAPVFEGIAPSHPPEPEIGVAEAEGLARAEIPDWLEVLRPRPEAAAEREPMETEGPLEGLRGVLSPTSAIKVPALRERAPLPEISEVSLARAQLLQSLLTRPAEAPQPEVRAPGVRVTDRVQRWLVMAALLIAVGSMLVAPLIIPPGSVPTLARPAESPAADGRMEFQRLARMYDLVQSVRAGDTVLVAFEYGPPEADELDLVAGPVLQQLLDQGAHISIVSTRPEGQAVAAGLLGSIVASEERYAGQYRLLHYRTGNAAGVSQLLVDAQARPGLIVVLTAQPGPLRWWVEQTRALYGDALPVVAGMSAALEPAASPYLDVSAGQLGGAISGLSGAAAYEALRGSAGKATQRLNAMAAGHAAIVGVMILGAVFYTLGGLRRRGK